MHEQRYFRWENISPWIQPPIVNMWTLLLLQRSRFLMGPLHIITFQFCIDEFVQNFSSSTFNTSFFSLQLLWVFPSFFNSDILFVLGELRVFFLGPTGIRRIFEAKDEISWVKSWMNSFLSPTPSSFFFSLSVSLPLPPSLSLGTLWLHIKFSESTADQQTLRKFD